MSDKCNKTQAYYYSNGLGVDFNPGFTLTCESRDEARECKSRLKVTLRYQGEINKSLFILYKVYVELIEAISVSKVLT